MQLLFLCGYFRYLMVQKQKGFLPLFDSLAAPPREVLGFSCTVFCFMVDELPSCPAFSEDPFLPFLRMHSSSISYTVFPSIINLPMASFLSLYSNSVCGYIFPARFIQ